MNEKSNKTESTSNNDDPEIVMVGTYKNLNSETNNVLYNTPKIRVINFKRFCERKKNNSYGQSNQNLSDKIKIKTNGLNEISNNQIVKNNMTLKRVNQNESCLNNQCEEPKPEKLRLTIEMYKSINDSFYENDNNLNNSVLKKDQEALELKTLPGRSIITPNNTSVSCQTQPSPLLSIEYIKDNDKAIEFYTGLQNYEKFIFVFKTLGPDAYNLEYYYSNEQINLSVLDQFFMTLILLRQHKTHYEISLLFNVTLRLIKNIFITWIRFMHIEWKSLNIKLSPFYKPKIKILLEKRNEKSKLEILDTNQDNTCDKKFIYLKNTNSDLDAVNKFKKVYKILNGPLNYIESHLMTDIINVCYTLCYFKTKNITKESDQTSSSKSQNSHFDK